MLTVTVLPGETPLEDPWSEGIFWPFRNSVIVKIPVVSASLPLVILAVPPKSPRPSFLDVKDWSIHPLSFGFAGAAGLAFDGWCGRRLGGRCFRGWCFGDWRLGGGRSLTVLSGLVRHRGVGSVAVAC